AGVLESSDGDRASGVADVTAGIAEDDGDSPVVRRRAKAPRRVAPAGHRPAGCIRPDTHRPDELISAAASQSRLTARLNVDRKRRASVELVPARRTELGERERYATRRAHQLLE